MPKRLEETKLWWMLHWWPPPQDTCVRRGLKNHGHSVDLVEAGLEHNCGCKEVRVVAAAASQSVSECLCCICAASADCRSASRPPSTSWPLQPQPMATSQAARRCLYSQMEKMLPKRNTAATTGNSVSGNRHKVRQGLTYRSEEEIPGNTSPSHISLSCHCLHC